MAHYKALENIAEFKKGEHVPEDRALVWRGMYVKSPVGECDCDAKSLVAAKAEFDKADSPAPKEKPKKKMWGKGK